MNCPQCGRCEPVVLKETDNHHRALPIPVCRQWLSSTVVAVASAKARWGAKKHPTPEQVIAAYCDTRYQRQARLWWHLWHRLLTEVAVTLRPPVPSRQPEVVTS